MYKKNILKAVLSLLLVLILGSSAYGYWVDQIDTNWDMSFNYPVSIKITGLQSETIQPNAIVPSAEIFSNESLGNPGISSSTSASDLDNDNEVGGGAEDANMDSGNSDDAGGEDAGMDSGDSDDAGGDDSGSDQ